MCGRYGRFSRKERIEAVLGRSIEGPGELEARYNVCPGLPDWVIRQPAPEAGLRFDQLHWGLLPSWAKNPKASRRPINARAETVAGKPMFRERLRQRRCVVPIDGYYEWRTTSCGELKVSVNNALLGRTPDMPAMDILVNGKEIRDNQRRNCRPDQNRQ